MSPRPESSPRTQRRTTRAGPRVSRWSWAPAFLDVEVLQLAASTIIGLAQLTVGVALFRAVRGKTSTSTVAPESSIRTD
jgi:hypothetical protein